MNSCYMLEWTLDNNGYTDVFSFQVAYTRYSFICQYKLLFHALRGLRLYSYTLRIKLYNALHNDNIIARAEFMVIVSAKSFKY